MENLKKAVIKEIETRYTVTASDYKVKKGEKESRAYRLIGRPWNAKPYTGTKKEVKEKIRKALEKKKVARITEQLEKVSSVESAPDILPFTLIIRLEAVKSRMYGWQWKGKDSRGHEGRFTGGCGYDKHSTALAEILNMNTEILKKMYRAKDKEIEKSNNEVLGYGAGYGVLPYFESGVGSNCHVSILESLGYAVSQSNDVFVIVDKETKAAK